MMHICIGHRYIAYLVVDLWPHRNHRINLAVDIYRTHIAQVVTHKFRLFPQYNYFVKLFYLCTHCSAADYQSASHGIQPPHNKWAFYLENVSKRQSNQCNKYQVRSRTATKNVAKYADQFIIVYMHKHRFDFNLQLQHSFYCNGFYFCSVVFFCTENFV